MNYRVLIESLNIDYGKKTLNLDDPASIAKFRINYRNGKYQAGCMERLYFAQHDDFEFLVCSAVEGVTPSYLVPVAFVPAYDGIRPILR